MRVIGILVFTLSVLVYAIVCPGYRLDYVPPVPPFDLRSALVEPEDYPDAYIKVRAGAELEKVTGPMAVFEKGDIIVGWNKDGHLSAICNSEEKVIIRNKATRTTYVLTPQVARDFDLLPYLSARAREQVAKHLAESSSSSEQPSGPVFARMRRGS